jgi:hypothetical protein
MGQKDMDDGNKGNQGSATDVGQIPNGIIHVIPFLRLNSPAIIEYQAAPIFRTDLITLPTPPTKDSEKIGKGTTVIQLLGIIA